MLLIRAGAVSDAPLLLRFFRELAEYERHPDAVVISEQTLIRDGFGAKPKFFVRETHRGRGVGRAILSEVARIARQEGSYGIRWEVLGWNESAIKFYKSLGGEFFDEWKQVLLDTDALNRLADG